MWLDAFRFCNVSSLPLWLCFYYIYLINMHEKATTSDISQQKKRRKRNSGWMMSLRSHPSVKSSRDRRLYKNHVRTGRRASEQSPSRIKITFTRIVSIWSAFLSIGRVKGCQIVAVFSAASAVLAVSSSPPILLPLTKSQYSCRQCWRFYCQTASALYIRLAGEMKYAAKRHVQSVRQMVRQIKRGSLHSDVGSVGKQLMNMKSRGFKRLCQAPRNNSSLEGKCM